MIVIDNVCCQPPFLTDGRADKVYLRKICGRAVLHLSFRHIESQQHKFENVDFVNAGIIGSSGYGGYNTILALERKEIICGVAFNPVNDWRLYSKSVP